MGRKKLTYEYVKNYIESFNYKLESTKYKNSSIKMKLICPKDHKFEIRWNDFKRGGRCSKCFGSKILTYEYIKEYIESFNYELLSTEYINSKKLKFKCPKGHKFKMTWNTFKSGIRCAECYGNKKYNIEYIQKQLFKMEPNYKLLSKNYINSKTKLKLKCSKGHKFSMSWNCFQSGTRCIRCHYNSMYKNYTKIEIKELEKYRANIRQLSNQNYYKYYYQINPKKLKRGYNYHLDHIFSVMEGFRRNIPPKYIANPYNLQILPKKENISKFDTCWQSEKLLYQGYAKYKNREERESGTK